MDRLLTFVRRAGSLFGATLLAACASAPGPAATGTGTPETPDRAPGPTAPRSEVPARERPDPGVSLALREQSAAAARAGDLDRAVAILERALRIEPERAELWLGLARLHRRRGDLAGALGFARKARRLAGDDRRLAREADALVAEIEAALRAGARQPAVAACSLAQR
jgi:cytochrome c-type biogenesis protein CcmH/NrfG